ncbi:hypothetical protein D3C72_1248660 [compost metagenome]
MLSRVPAADLDQHDDGQQRREDEPRNVTFSVGGNDHGGQQRAEGAAKIAADLEQRLRQPMTST